MHRPGSLVSLSYSLTSLLAVSLLGVLLTACSTEQMGPGHTGGVTGVTGVTSVTTAQPTTMGPSTTSDTSTGSSGTTEGTGTGTSTGMLAGTSGESGASSGSSSGDSGVGGTGTTGEEVELTDCFGCLCDLSVSVCRIVFPAVQPAAFAGPEELCPIVEAETESSGCVLFPDDCADPPSCDCLPTMDGGCFCNEYEPGRFQIHCPLP